MKAPRIKYSVRLPAELTRRLADHARSRRASQTAVIEAALESFLSPDSAERLEAALARRLDRLTRQHERLEWNVELSNETLALFIRTWLNNAAPPPEGSQKAVQAIGKERWERFVEALTRRMELGPKLQSEISRDVAGAADSRP